MAATTVDVSARIVNAIIQAIGVAFLALGSAIAIVFAAAAALTVGCMVAIVALAGRLWPKRRSPPEAVVLEARKTPTGWVVESAARGG
jgi:hypothetical protein